MVRTLHHVRKELDFERVVRRRGGGVRGGGGVAGEEIGRSIGGGGFLLVMFVFEGCHRLVGVGEGVGRGEHHC